MPRINLYLLSLLLGVSVSSFALAADSKPKAPTAAAEQVVQNDSAVAKMDEVMEREAPVSFQKSTYDEHMINVNWMNRNGYVIGAPAWKGGEDGLHCH